MKSSSTAPLSGSAEPTSRPIYVDQEYGLRNFVLQDPDGNILTFSAPLEH